MAMGNMKSDDCNPFLVNALLAKPFVGPGLLIKSLFAASYNRYTTAILVIV